MSRHHTFKKNDKRTLPKGRSLSAVDIVNAVFWDVPNLEGIEFHEEVQARGWSRFGRMKLTQCAFAKSPRTDNSSDDGGGE